MIRIQKLASGARFATDPMKSVRSCAIGIWIETGSRNERPAEHGIAHFIEHMLFKGTPRYNSLELADELNRLGGNVNAHTSQEVICLHARCVDTKAPEVLDLLSEMLLESTYPEEEIVRERNVILEEYKMYDDNPDELVLDLFYEQLWPDHPLGRSIIGEPARIRQFSRKTIGKYMGREFDPSRVLVVLSGSFDADICGRIVRKRFGKLRRRGGAKRPGAKKAQGATKRRLLLRDVEQTHFCFGLEGPPRGAPDRYAFGLMNMVLGGGMSSRLFKEIREKRGLAYSVQSFAQPFHGVGSFAIAGSTSPDTLDEVLRISLREVRRMCEEEPSETEIHGAREQIVDSLLIGLESTYSRMVYHSESILTHGRSIPQDIVARRIKGVTGRAIRESARKYLEAGRFAEAYIAPKGSRITPLTRLQKAASQSGE